MTVSLKMTFLASVNKYKNVIIKREGMEGLIETDDITINHAFC